MTDALAGRRVLVLGLGVSGRSAAAYCADRGALVTAADERSRAELGPLEALEGRATLRTGRPFPDPADFELVVPSPGVPPARYAARARRVKGDLELAGEALSLPIVAVTGTNGKSTTVRLVEALCRAAGLRARAAGNVGEPALDLVGAPLDVAVLEASSFQLESTERFRPRVAVWLGLSEDHLDRHGSLEAYAAAKARIFAHQTAEDVAILCADDPRARALAPGLAARVQLYGRAGPFEEGAWWDAGAAVLRRGGETLRLPLEGAPPVAGPARENRLAALLAACAVGADPAKAARAFSGFAPLPHRGERVGEAAGAAWVDDSKATNPGAALAAIRGESAPLLWIAGGRDKGLDFAPLAAGAEGRVRRALLVGEAAEKLERALAGRVPCERVGTVERAVGRAAELAEPGDVVLLAPGCASLDQFRSAEERGERFRAAVAALAGEARP